MNVKVQVKVSKVTHAYNGRVGCMCGCNGDYVYTEAAKGPGYKVDRNDRKVASRVAQMNRLLSSGDYDELDVGSTYVYVQRGGRCFAAYFD